jgi:glycosyltransferase involved in cell wall biosynthesis
MKISVVTVSYNSCRTIEDTILSVISQANANFEHIIIDGGSTDATQSMLDKYRAHFSYVVVEKDNGIYDAMNKGIGLCSGDVICFLNSDDTFFDNDVLSRVSLEFSNNFKVGAVLSNVVQDSNGNINRLLSAEFFAPWQMRFGFNPPHPGIFLRSSIYEQYGLFKLDYLISADIELMVRLFCKERVSFSHIDFTSVKMKVGGVSTSGWHSTHIISKEMVRACKSNNINTNYLLVLLRLPLKWFFQKVLFKLKG